jgi:hypothetical protein
VSIYDLVIFIAVPVLVGGCWRVLSGFRGDIPVPEALISA